MGLFGSKKNKNKEKEEAFFINEVEETEKSLSTKMLDRGTPTLKEFIAPPSFDRGHQDYIKVGDKYVRNFVMNGFPSLVSVGWLEHLYNYDGDMDVAIHIEPADDRLALDELTNKITQFEAQYMVEQQKGNIRNITSLQDKISQLYDQRRKLEQNYENLFYVQIASNLYADTEEQLKQETEKLENTLKGRKINMMPTYLRQDDGYKTVLPFGKTYLPDLFRNFNTGALTSTFPFYNPEIIHEKGVFLGADLYTSTPVMIDFYDRSIFSNSNITVIGKSGYGKTYTVSLLTMRSTLRGIRTVIIDPEDEYREITKSLNGAIIEISPGSKSAMNPFDVEVEVEDDGTEILKLDEKINDVLNLISVMAGKEGLSREESSIVATVLQNLYADFGFTENPNSLYTETSEFDEATGTFYTDGVRKPMPTFSDFHELLTQYGRDNGLEVSSLTLALEHFKRGGIHGMFDTQTSADLVNFKDRPVVTFDISKLEENILRPIGMYVALSWSWEKFGKKNPHIKKRIVCDEAWMLVNKNMAGHEYTSKFLEVTSRRIRKRNGGLLVASQKFTEFANSDQGKAVISNAEVKIFLRQDATDIDAVQDTFNLSDGERLALLQAPRGEALIKMPSDTALTAIIGFKYESDKITKKSTKKAEDAVAN